MSFDGLFTRAIAKELKERLESGRISKIYQPSKYEILLHMRARGKNEKLLISAHPSYARLHMTAHSYDSPALPPMFCMLLRKHLEGGILEKVEQVELERIIHFTVRSRNEIGDESLKTLIVEIMGRHSNMILVDAATGTILDSLKHLSPAVNRHRTVFPGYAYVAPPAQHKLNPLTVESAEQLLRPLDFLAGKMDKQLVAAFAGLSPLFAKEVIHKAGLVNERSLPAAFFDLMYEVKEHAYTPTMLTSEAKETFYMLPLSHVPGEARTFDSLSLLLDRFFFGKGERDRVKQQAHDLERLITNELAKNEKKLEKLYRELQDAEKSEQYQLYGELLTANMYNMKRGQSEIAVINYYDEDGATITIPLNPLKTPSENAQSYFIRYQKAKNSVSIIEEQIAKTEADIQYFEGLLQQMESASQKDTEEIREELVEEGYLRSRAKGQKKQKPIKPAPDRYLSTGGIEILVGKNNKQNDYVTHKLARRDEIWLHTKDIPGSHVVIRSTEPDEQTLHEAAVLAAYFSKAKQSGSVPVDYTKIRHVKKPSGAKLGFVTYDNQQTLYVTPDEDLVLQLKA